MSLTDFRPDEVSFGHALEPFAQRLAGHQKGTDAYLLGLKAIS
jgi:hypothetical protein